MKLTVQRIMEVVPLIHAIITEKRPLPQKGAYRLARLHAKLQPEFATAHAQRDAMIRAYDTPELAPPPKSAADPLGQGPDVPTGNYMVPADKLEEFTAAWDEIAKEAIEVDLQPIPLEQLDLGDDKAACVNALELVVMGDLVEG